VALWDKSLLQQEEGTSGSVVLESVLITGTNGLWSRYLVEEEGTSGNVVYSRYLVQVKGN
jgi:hypothetical protein